MNVLALLSGVAWVSVLGAVLNAFLQRRKMEAESLAILERERGRAEQLVREHALRAIALAVNLRRIAPQDATPEQWAARQPQDAPVVDRSVWPAQPTEGENHE